jgi:YebC/PmpR family DNA-binding regulatory protein
MAGHSKWANIKHRKERQDAKRGKIFTKWIRELTVAARRAAVTRLQPASAPGAGQGPGRQHEPRHHRRAVARGAGAADTDDMVELTYEGYGPGGVAVMVECMTDNRNRTAAAVRHAFSKCGGNLGTDGSVAYLFERKGQISFAPGRMKTR